MNSVPSPTSRSGKRIHLSIWDLIWALVTPILALYLGGALILTNAEWNPVVQYWLITAILSLLAFYAFRLQDGMNRNFSVQQTVDIFEAVLFIELMTLALLCPSRLSPQRLRCVRMLGRLIVIG